MTKPYPIPKAWVWEACQSVKANGGSAGIDRETLETFERRLGDNLYKLWNRLCLRQLLSAAGQGRPDPEEIGRGARSGGSGRGRPGRANRGEAGA